MAYWVYILCCADRTLYVGYTGDLAFRLRQHNLGKGARYTRSRRPVELAASWNFEDRREAMRHEYRLKTLSRPQKLRLLAEHGAPSP